MTTREAADREAHVDVLEIVRGRAVELEPAGSRPSSGRRSPRVGCFSGSRRIAAGRAIARTALNLRERALRDDFAAVRPAPGRGR